MEPSLEMAYDGECDGGAYERHLKQEKPEIGGKRAGESSSGEEEEAFS